MPSGGRAPAAKPAPPPSGGRSGPPRALWIALAAFVVIAGVSLVAFGGGGAPGPSPSAASSAPPSSVGPSASPFAGATTGVAATFDPNGTDPINGITCDPNETFVSHTHTKLFLRWDGAEVPVPADVGIRRACLYWLHTHADQGIIHVESPVERTFTLGDFFAIWGQPLSPTQVADRVVGTDEQVFAFVNGEPFSGDPATIPLADLEHIELQVGTAPTTPFDYTFPPDFL